MMIKQKLLAFAASACACLLLCSMIFWGRAATSKYFEANNRENAQDVLLAYQQKIVAQLQYEWNRARELSYEVSADSVSAALFERFAGEVLSELEVPARAGLIDKTEVVSMLPAEYSGGVGKTLQELPYVFNMARLVGGVVEGPGDYFGDGWESFLFLSPVETPEGEFWGEVFVCIDAQAVLSSLELGELEARGYEYELWCVDAQDGKKVTVSASDSGFDYSHGERTEFELPGRWTLTVMPRAGWVSKTEVKVINAVTALFLILAFGIGYFLARVVITQRDRRHMEFMDRESGMFNRRGLEREMNRWILGRNRPLVLLYFVVDGFNHVSQLAGRQRVKEYLEEARTVLHGGILSAHVLGRVGEGNFCAVIEDDMTCGQMDDLARCLAMGLIWKTKEGTRKEFLNVGFQYVRYPQDGKEAGALLDKAVSDYFTRVNEESPVLSLTEKCRQLLEGRENVEFEEYSDTYMLRLSQIINQYRKQVEQLAYRDPVYHIGNRSKYIRDARVLISYDKKRPFTLYCVDICSFSRYNELFSVETGDRILREVIERLHGVFGDFLYRINGDVFLGILQGAPQVEEAAASIFSCLTTPVHIGTLRLSLEANCGVCAYPQHSHTPEDLLECVQTALHFAKRHDTEKLAVYDETLTKVLRQEVHILNLLESNLAQKTLEVWYQPVLNLEPGRFSVAEALMRLPDGNGAYVSAAQAVAIAEKNRIVGRIGLYVLRKVSAFIAAHAEKLGLERVGLNLSVQELLLENCVENILKIVRENGISPEKISLEITETVLIQSFDKICPILLKLREAGFHIVLDDFGTGYSSLNYFSKLPIDVLKIDRSLIHNAVDSKKQLVLLKTVMEMARVNQIRVVAEGVETVEERQIIEEIGADYIQGFYYAKPMPEEALPEWYAHSAPKLEGHS